MSPLRMMILGPSPTIWSKGESNIDHVNCMNNGILGELATRVVYPRGDEVQPRQPDRLCPYCCRNGTSLRQFS